MPARPEVNNELLPRPPEVPVQPEVTPRLPEVTSQPEVKNELLPRLPEVNPSTSLQTPGSYRASGSREMIPLVLYCTME